MALDALENGMTIRRTRPHPAAAEPPTWRQRALCRAANVELFYPPSGCTARTAKAWCAVCPVRESCLADALERRERHGVWGGLDEDERVAVLRRMQRTAAAPAGGVQ